MKLIPLIFLFLTSRLFATYIDKDIDGVEDKFDKCPYTPFDELVDVFGCSKKDNAGTFIFKLGTDISFDTTDERISTYNFLLQYEKKNWVAGISNSNYIGYDNNDISVRETGDIYTYLGYNIQNDVLSMMLTSGIKIATAKTTVGTGENDYYMSTQIATKLLDDHYKFFTALSYTFTGDTPTIKYKNIFSYTLGVGYTVNAQYYTSLAYENSQSIYENTENYKALVWSNYYAYNDDYFLELDYVHSLDEFSYKHLISFKVGVTFE
jgi:hypothetical protein